MKTTRVGTAVVAGSFDWVLVRVETDEGITGLGEAYCGASAAELAHKVATVLIGENPIARAHLKPGSCFFGNMP